MSSSKSAKLLLYGNEALAFGAYHEGCQVASAYPGTPSTEIIETMAQFRDIHVEWSTNEKVALEVAIGASIGGKRAMASMKHVGLNVASDPLMTVSYMGVRGGLVIITADDPGMHSSQNEQDNRWYGRFAKIPVLEPSSSQEGYQFIREAFRMSEDFDTPVLVRSTTRVSHARSVVELGERTLPKEIPYSKDMVKYVMLPANARRRKPLVLERIRKLEELAGTSQLNRLEWGKKDVGFITGGISYQYVKEAFPEASVLKLGISYPLPEGLIKDFASKVERLYVVEELDDFWEEEILAMGVKVIGKRAGVFPFLGELGVGVVKESVEKDMVRAIEVQAGEEIEGGDKSREGAAELILNPDPSSLPPRPPVLCPGCPHRGVYYVLKKLKLIVTGDIGCYTLGALPPLSSLDTTTCMGASIGHAQGMKLSLSEDDKKRLVAVIGDSTFVHSGITGLLNMTYNQVDVPVVILDNGTTAMTGHQGHPASGLNARRELAPKVSLEEIAKAAGRKNVLVVDAFNLSEVENAVRFALLEPSTVIIARGPCVLTTKERKRPIKLVDDLCIQCGLCLRIGCPALERDGKKPRVNQVLCTGCQVCAQICPKNALVTEEGEN